MRNWLGSAWSQQNPHGNLQSLKWEAISSFILCLAPEINTYFSLLGAAASWVSLGFCWEGRKDRTNTHLVKRKAS